MLKPMVKQGLAVLHSSLKTEKELIMHICVFTCKYLIALRQLGYLGVQR